MTSTAIQAIDVVHRFYDAMHRLDVRAVLDTLTEDFVGHVSAGMPGAVGGTHHGATTMLDDVWVPVYRGIGALPHPLEYLPAGHDTVVVVGEYRAAAGYESFTAAFVHVLRLDGGRIAELRQVTDTRRWPDMDP